MRSRRRISIIAGFFITLLTCLSANAQTIRTFAGGGPNNIPATLAALQNPLGSATDAAGNLYFVDAEQARIYKVDTSGVITLVAGNGFPGFSGDGGPATSAELASPSGVAVDSSGNVFIADTNNNRIRKVAVSTGIITTVAGNGTAAFSGDGGPATSAGMSPGDVAVDSSGNLFVTDASNQRIRKVTASTGIITTVAGDGAAGFSGDGGPATGAELSTPSNVALDSSGDFFISDEGNNRIRKVTASTGIITTVAGNGTAGFSGDGGPATSAELSAPTDVAVDSAGDLFIADSNNNRIREVMSATGIINTVAGNGTNGFSGDGEPATSAELSSLLGVTVNSAGELFIVDNKNTRIRVVAASTGIINTFCGDGLFIFGGDGFWAAGAQLANPESVAVDSAGNLFIGDTANNRIRRVDASTDIITTVAGNGTGGFSGDGGPATSAELNGGFRLPVAVDSSGNLFIGDTGNDLVREVTASTGIITTVAGTGTIGFSGDGGPATSAQLDFPAGVAVDPSGNFFIADAGNNRIRKVTASTGVITTVAGNGTAGFSGDGGPATSAELGFPNSVAVDSSGNFFVCDAANNRIRGVTASSGIINTVAGNGTSGFSGDGGPATSAELSFGSGCGVGVDSSGDIFIADLDNQRVREVTTGATAPAAILAPNPVPFGNEPKGTTSAPQTVILSNSGTANLSVTGIAFSGANAVDFSQTNTCGTLPATLASSTSCDVNVTFTPSTTAAEGASLAITDNASNSPQSDALSGTGTASAPAATLSPASVPVGNEIVGTTSAAQTVTITNTGNANLSITGIAINGANASDFHQNNTCGTLPATLTPSNSCNVSVSFTPSATEAESASLAIKDNASNSPQSVPLTGNGTDFSESAASGGSTSATVTAGQTATYNLQVNPVNGFTGTVSLTCTGAPTAAVCSASPSSPMISGATAAPFTVTVTTTKRGITLPARPLALPRNFLRLWSALLGLLLFLLLTWAYHKKSQPDLRGSKTCVALLAAALGLVLLCAGCSGGSSGPTGTPTGTYTLTVSGNTSGASGSATRMLSLTLNVN